MTKLFLTTLSLLAFACMSAKTIVVVNNGNEPLPNAIVTFYGEANDSISTVQTSQNGKFEFDTPPVRSFTIEAADYATRYVEAQTLKSDTIVMTTAGMLDEVVVNASNMGYKTFRLSKEDMLKYSNFFECLNEIPMMTVLPGSSEVYYRGRADVALLVDGVRTTVSEFQTISKNDISRVNVYDNPPQQYIDQGFAYVIDVITKSGLQGGTVGLNINQAPYPTQGNNTAAVYYNYKRSKWSLLYDNNNSHANDVRYDQELDYEFQGIRYDKRKEGMKSKSDFDNNNLRISFQNSKSMDYIYNVRLGGSLNTSKRNYMQDVETVGGDVLDGENHLSTNAKNLTFENYFEKYLGDGGNLGNISADVLYTHRNTSYSSFYREHGNGSSLVNSVNEYDISYNSLMAWLAYSMPAKKWGSTSLTVSNNYRESSYDDNVTPIKEKTNEMRATLRHRYMVKNLAIMPGVGVEYNHITTNGQVQNIWEPYAQLQFNLNLQKGFGMELSYTYYETNPSIGQLSETNQWLDTKLVYHGNPNLRAYKTHNVSLFASWYYNRYFMFNMTASYDNMPGYILDHFVTTNDFYLQTLENMKRFSELKGNLNIYVYPFGRNNFTLMSQLIGGKIWGKGSSYSWNGYRFLWNITAVYSIQRWTLMGTYSYPGKLSSGQLVIPQPEYWAFVAQYRPSNDVSIGLQLTKPFGKSFRSGEYTVPEAPVHIRSFTDNRSMCNLVNVLFSWNFQFGKKQINDKPSIKISDSDTGIITK